jgi:O-antigen ligase
LIVGIYYFLKLIRKFPLWVSLTSSLFIIILLTTSLIKFTRIGDTINALQKADNNSKDMRMYLWSDALKVFKSAPLIGHGIGDGEAEISAKHNENRFIDIVHARSNAHNQYLETATQTGIIGLLSLILMLSVPFIRSIRKKQEVLFLFLIIIGVNFLFESMLMKLSGVLFIGFWLSFLLIIQDNSGPAVSKNSYSI